jgi:hypothetical protein
MHLQKTAAQFAVIAALAFAFSAPADASDAVRNGDGRVIYAAQAGGASGPSGFVDFSDTGDSGAGFYPLPEPGRASARRLHSGAAIDSEAAIGAAMASEAVGDDLDEGYAFGNSHSVFNPVDGAGTPFFGGYYNH